MIAKEAREITNAAKFPGVDSVKQMADIMATIQSLAEQGKSTIQFQNVTDENAKLLIADGYSLSRKSDSTFTTISW